jgi:dihydrolipoamide dehydrogenase
LKSIDLRKLIDYKEGVVNQMTKGLEGLLKRRKVTTITGTATMTAPHEISVELSDSSDTVHLQATDVVVATGSHPRHLPGTQFSRKAILSSQDALNLQQIPSSVVIIGSGPIGLEFATLWSSIGAEVTVLEVADRVLPSATPRVSATISRDLKRAGVHCATNVTIDSLEEGVNQSATVHYREDEGDEQTLTAQFALVAIGRLPNTDADWFSAIGIDLDERGLVKTDAYGRTSVPGVWALGDITAGKQLAHRAFAQGLVVAESIAGIDTEPVDDHTVPAVTFAMTEVGSVGYARAEAETVPELSEVKETTFPMLGNARVVMSGDSGSVTVVSGIRADRPGVPVVLGVQMVGPGVSELTAEAQQLVGNRIPLHEASRLVHPHPTLSETLGEALLSADGRPLHTR